jgi:hypothetical protein
MKKLFLILATAIMFSLSVCAQGVGGTNETPKEGNVKIKITIGGKECTATMTDSAAARDFVSLFPLTLTLEDYNRTEKISNLPQKLSTAGAPPSYDPSVGDICLYAPWGNLCIFYRDFSSSGGLVLLGKIDGGVDAFNVSGSLTAKFEALK